MEYKNKMSDVIMIKFVIGFFLEKFNVTVIKRIVLCWYFVNINFLTSIIVHLGERYIL